MMLLKFVNPYKYIEVIENYFWRCCYNLKTMEAVENVKFLACGFDKDRAMMRLSKILNEMNFAPYTMNGGMESAHWLIFSCLAEDTSIKRILEIGTYNGQTTALLSRLFPESEITTVDLPESDPTFRKIYGYMKEEEISRYLELRATNTSSQNIVSIEMNSFFLPSLNIAKFDLVWVDAWHFYPQVAWDVNYAYHITRPGGIIMIDDVVSHPRPKNSRYLNGDAFRVIEFLRERIDGHFELFLKRLDPHRSADPRKRKFVALLRKGLSNT